MVEDLEGPLFLLVPFVFEKFQDMERLHFDFDDQNVFTAMSRFGASVKV